MSPAETLMKNLTDALGPESAAKAALITATTFLEFADHAMDQAAGYPKGSSGQAIFATLSGSYVGMAETIHDLACHETGCDLQAALTNVFIKAARQ